MKKLSIAPLIVAAVAVAGSLALYSSRAAGPFVATEPEQGTITSPASSVTDASASGGAAVRFSSSAAPVNGMLTSDPNFFPIAVWLQTPESAAVQYKAIGINTFVGLWDGVTHSNLSALSTNGLSVIPDQDTTGLTDPLGSSVIKAWLPYDEPDNAQDNGNGGYDPCIPTSTLQAKYDSYKAADPLKRPVQLGFGRGVADVNWIGRGTCTGDTQYYVRAASAADFFAFDIYPRNNDGGKLYLVAQGVDNLRSWTGGVKPVWADIETTAFSQGNGVPTPADVKFEVWSAIIHGAKGIDYFCHIFSPTFIEAGLLSLTTMKTAVANINAQITSLAAVINIGTPLGNTVSSSAGTAVPVDTMTRTYNGSTYIFAAAMRGAATTGTFRPNGLTSGTVTVVGENRTLTLSNGGFSDSFAGYDTHIYKIDP